MYRITPQGFIDDAGRTSAFLELPPAASAVVWNEKQQRSMDEYLEHSESLPEHSRAFYDLFDAYISAATYARKSLKILDVGCGISANAPLYVTTLVGQGIRQDRIYVGLDPIRHNVTSRSYPFICGRIEDLPKFLDDKFDVFLFSTTLDHFEHIDAVADIVRQIANRDAICIFWLGLHDTQIVAEQMGASYFLKLYRSLNPLRFFVRYGVTLLQLLRFYLIMRRRQHRLATGQPLDDIHFHYFTMANIRQYLELFGRITSRSRVPGTNTLFATVVLGDDPR